ncbi:M28 family metallopeptidase [Aquimarina sp. M1]
MIKPIYFQILLIILFGCNTTPQIELTANKLPLKTIDAQINIVSVLTGNENVGNTKYFINSRTTQKEKLIARVYISEIIKQLNLTPVEHHYQEPNTNPFIDLLVSPFNGTNLFTIVPSETGSDEYIVLGAHYDTARNCPGANDNAAAIAVLYGVIKKLTEIPSRNKNLIIVFFDQEEEDLVGSSAFAKYLAKNNFNVHSVHTFDQIGWDKDGDKAVELELPTLAIEELYKIQADQLNIPIHITKVNSTDHQSFRDLGFTAVGITEEYAHGDTSPFKDTKEDTFDTVNFEYIASTTQLVFEVIQQLVTDN